MIDKDTWYGTLLKIEELEKEVKYYKEENEELEKCLEKLPDDVYNKYIAEIE